MTASGPEGAPSGRNVDTVLTPPQVEADSAEMLPTHLERSDIQPHPIPPGGTEIVMQRHGRYSRDSDDPNVGSLTPEARVAEKDAAEAYFTGFLEQLPEDERNSVDVLFVASDTRYLEGGRRSYETAVVAQEAAEEVFNKHGVTTDNIVNISHELKGNGGPKPMPKLREPQMFSESPEFVEFLKERHGDLNQKFWIAFEEDHERKARQEMGAEGPDDIADRTDFSIRTLARYAGAYHEAKPGRRLIIWVDTHYDTISPYVKRNVLGQGKEYPLMVDYGGGFTIDIDPSGNATTELGGTQFKVPLQR